MFARLSDWGLAIGAIALAIGFYASSRPSPYNAYNYFSHPLDLWLVNSAMALIPGALFLLAIGMLGLWAGQRGKVPGPGGFFLLAGAFSGLVSMIASFGALAALDGWWVVFTLGLLVYFIGLALYDILALALKPFRRFNFIPLLARIWVPIYFLLGAITSFPQAVGNIVLLLSCLGLLSLGLLLNPTVGSLLRPASKRYPIHLNLLTPAAALLA